MNSEKAIERSIDSLQRICAVIIGVALAQAMTRSFMDLTANEITKDFKNLPEFIGFIFTVVPFAHGMNRHMDKVLTKSLQEKYEKERRRKLFILLINYTVFLTESCTLVLMALSITSEPKVRFFQILMALLAVDVIWTVLTRDIGKDANKKWLLVNLITVVIYVVVIYFLYLSVAQKSWLLMSIAVLRTVLDYWVSPEFYFPSKDG